MELILTRVIEAFIVPPGLMIALMIVGFLVRFRWYASGQVFMLLGFLSLLLASMPVVSGGLSRFYESIPPLADSDLKRPAANAIVILGGGRYADAPEFAKQDTVSQTSLERLRYGAYVQRITGLPIMVTGGRVYGEEAVSEAVLMKQTLERDFIANVRWVEDQSGTTFGNAVHARSRLAKANIDKIYLVTHALHMPRAKEAFAQAGFDVIPAPLGFTTPSNRPLALDLLPSAHALHESSRLMHELWGRWWYRLRYY